MNPERLPVTRIWSVWISFFRFFQRIRKVSRKTLFRTSLSKAAEVLSLEALDVLLDFLNSQAESDPGVSFRSIRRSIRTTDAWPLSTFSRMAELVLSQAAVSEGRYIEKAAEDAGEDLVQAALFV